jgi:hypothetical protein
MTSSTTGRVPIHDLALVRRCAEPPNGTVAWANLSMSPRGEWLE